MPVYPGSRARVSALGSTIAAGIAGIAVEPMPLPLSDSPPPLRRGAVLVAVGAAAVNYPDLLMANGGYQYSPPLPYTPGIEAAGIVIAVGPGVQEVAIGDLVMCTNTSGLMASVVVIDAQSCTPLPSTFDFAAGAAFMVAATTAYHCLVERGGLTAADSVLVNGATGGVGLAAVQVCKAVGCGMIIATGGSATKLAVVAAHGATAVIDLSADGALDALPSTVKALSGVGVTVVHAFDIILPHFPHFPSLASTTPSPVP